MSGSDRQVLLRQVIRNESRYIGLVVYDENAVWGGRRRLIRHEQAGR